MGKKEAHLSSLDVAFAACDATISPRVKLIRIIKSNCELVVKVFQFPRHCVSPPVNCTDKLHNTAGSEKIAFKTTRVHGRLDASRISYIVFPLRDAINDFVEAVSKRGVKVRTANTSCISRIYNYQIIIFVSLSL